MTREDSHSGKPKNTRQARRHHCAQYMPFGDGGLNQSFSAGNFVALG